MNTYGVLLKRLIRFTNIKLTNLAEIVGYDTSYISKWCNKDKLPASKAASNVNKCLADVFAGEVYVQDEVALFIREFHLEEPADETELSASILHILKDAYKTAYDSTLDTSKPVQPSTYRLLLWQSEIKAFFKTELPELMANMNSDCEILCTMDICGFLPEFSFEQPDENDSTHQINIKMGLNMQQTEGDLNYVKQLYYFINHYSRLIFDFYDNSQMDLMNMIVIKDYMAIQCSLDKDNHIYIASIITDTYQVSTIYQKIASSFTSNRLLIHSSDSEELFYNGYRTEFYAHNKFQILLTRGFEFLLPPDIIPKLMQTSKEQNFDDNMSQLIAHLGITWEEIFEKGQVDFYLLKTALLKYISDGIIYFADVIYKMSIEERKQHIAHVLDLIQKNPNIKFYVIDDDFIPNASDLLHTSVYNNHKKLFLKNADRYEKNVDPRFYTIQNDRLISDISQYLESLNQHNCCNMYDAEATLRFYERYGTMIDRMLSSLEA